jgi:hypothetical protein
MLSFNIDTSKGETPASVARKRAIVQALMASQGAPKNIGEGLNALGDGIVENVLNRRADAAEQAGQAHAADIFGGLTNAGIFPAAPGGGSASPGTPIATASPRADNPNLPSSMDFAQAQTAPSSGPPSDLEAYIRQAAVVRGIDPDVAVTVARSEGGLKDPVRRSDYAKGGMREPSYGPCIRSGCTRHLCPTTSSTAGSAASHRRSARPTRSSRPQQPRHPLSRLWQPHSSPSRPYQRLRASSRSPKAMQPPQQAPAPQPDNLPVMAGGSADAVQPGQAGPSIQQIMQVAADPWASPEQKAMAA